MLIPVFWKLPNLILRLPDFVVQDRPVAGLTQSATSESKCHSDAYVVRSHNMKSTAMRIMIFPGATKGAPLFWESPNEPGAGTYHCCRIILNSGVST